MKTLDEDSFREIRETLLNNSNPFYTIGLNMQSYA